MRVLCVRLSSMGDIAQALPLVHDLLGRGHEVGWVVEERFRELLEALRHPRFRVLVWKRGVTGLRRLRGRGREYEVCLDFQGNWKSGLVSRVLGAPSDFGPAFPDLREKGNALFHRRRAPRAEGPHVLDRGRALLDAAGLASSGELPRPPFLEAPEEVPPQAPAWFLRGEGTPLAVLLGREGDPRSWPVGEALSLARTWPGPSFCLAGPEERGGRGRDPLLHRVSAPRIPELLALGAWLRKRGGVAVGPDIGPTHVLHAAGATCLFLFGAQDPRRTCPPGAEALLASEGPECRPCLRRRCGHPEGPVCMNRLASAEVSEVLARLAPRREEASPSGRVEEGRTGH